MPIYEYMCTKCGEEYEVLVMKDEDIPTSCKKCQGPLERLLSETNFDIQGYNAKNKYGLVDSNTKKVKDNPD